MKKIFADFIFDGYTIKHKSAISVNEEGVILEILDKGNFHPEDTEYYPGLICPGFVNAHGHLELSHLKGKMPTGIGLLAFLRGVVTLRDIDQSIIDEAIRLADAEMWSEGIVAAGDISNKMDTIEAKKNSKIKYYTFIEAFDLWQPTMAHSFFETYKKVYDQYGDLPKSMSPHAPYSVSPDLFLKINEINNENSILSIHNQEVHDEDLMFLDRSGGFISFIENFGFSMNHFSPIEKTSIHYSMMQLKPTSKQLWVHNTMMQGKDILSAIQWNPNSYFVTCPNANLYIENRLPNYKYLLEHKAKLCVGTDSLSSNWRLSILEELKTIQKFQSYIPMEDVLQWATLNGAEALGMDDWAGSFEVNKKPGILWIQNFKQQNGHYLFEEDARVSRLF